MKILLGPAGSPAKSTIDGIKVVSDLGLGAMEVAFTHGVRMGNDLARKIGEENKKYGISLSIHAPYYINLNSDDKRKIMASRKRILDSCERAHYMGAKKVIFHSAYYGKLSKKESYSNVRNEVESILNVIKKNNWDVDILAETMGRLSQFGDLDEVIALSRDTGCGVCIDPAHIYARNIGRIDFDDMLDKVLEVQKDNLHFHFSCINYGPRGELNHLVLKENKPPFKQFIDSVFSRKISCTIICESPITWEDSLNMKQIIEKTGYRFG